MAQDRFTVSFDKNEAEQELYEWIKDKAIIIGPNNFIKQLLYEKMIEEKNKKINS